MSAAVRIAPSCHTVEEPVLLRLGRRVEQWHQSQAEGRQAGQIVAVPADLGECRRDLSQSHTVATEPFGNPERCHTTGNQCLPSVLTIKHGLDDVGDSLLRLGPE